MTRDENRVILGRVSGLYGVQGWVKVFSHTDPRDRIANYNPLFLKRKNSWQRTRVSAGRGHGKGVVIKFQGIDDRDAAAALLGADIAVDREQLPPLAPGEVYWSDLEGLQVFDHSGLYLGTVDHLFSTGANDVMVVNGEREHLIPFVRDQVVTSIDFRRRRLQVDWDADF